MMKLRDLLNRTWYITKVIIVDDLGNEVDINKIKERAFFVGENHETRSVTVAWMLDKNVRSFGVMDDYLIIEVYRN